MDTTPDTEALAAQGLFEVAQQIRQVNVDRAQDLRRGSRTTPHAARRHQTRGSRADGTRSAIRESMGY